MKQQYRTLSRWTVATALGALAGFAVAQGAGDSAGGNAGPKSPPAKTSDGASHPAGSHDMKDKKAKRPATSASGAEHANPLGSTKKSDASKGPN